MRNQTLGITGMLIMCDGWFLQALEGGPQATTRLYNGIAGDERHHDIQLHSVVPIDERMFPDWSMKGIGPENLGADFVESLHGLFATENGNLCRPTEADTALMMLKVISEHTAKLHL